MLSDHDYYRGADYAVCALRRWTRDHRRELTAYDVELLDRIAADMSGDRGHRFVHPTQTPAA